MKHDVRYIKTSDVVTAFIDGKDYMMDGSNPNFPEVCELVSSKIFTDELVKKLTDLFSKVESLMIYFDSFNEPIEIENGIIYYKDFEIKSTIVNRIMEMKSRNIKPTNLLRFVERLVNNPSPQSINELYEFLDVNKLPINEDGTFMAYKRIRNDYMDCHSGTFDNHVGQSPRLKGGRNTVDPDRNRTCSNGLHVCSYEYLDSYTGERVVAVKVDPADVVTVPSDYNNSKMRVVGYTVVEEIMDWKSTKLVDYATEDDKSMVEDIMDFDEDYYDDDCFDDPEDWEDVGMGGEEQPQGFTHLTDDFQETINSYDLQPYNGVQYIEDFSNFYSVDYRAVNHDYSGVILAVIPANKDARDIIELLKKDDKCFKYFVSNQNPRSFLNYFEYECKLRRPSDDKDRYLVALTRRDDDEFDIPRFATPSVKLIDGIPRF